MERVPILCLASQKDRDSQALADSSVSLHVVSAPARLDSWVSWDHTPWTALYSLPSASDRSLLLLKAPDKSRTSTYSLQGFLGLTCCRHFRHPRPCSLPAGGTHVENCYGSSGPVCMSAFLSLLTQRFLGSALCSSKLAGLQGK